MEQEFTKITDHLEVIKRRRIPFALVFASIFLTAALLAIKLPPTYESEASILIEDQEIPEEFVQSTITTFADEQIQIIGQQVMTRGNLEGIVEQFNLFGGKESDAAMAGAIRGLQDSISIEPIRASVVDERTQRTGYVTIAFKVAFQYRDPQTAKAVVEKLTDLFLQANVAQRTSVASETTQFLQSEAERLNEEIVETEARMADFKQRFSDSLPELSDLNYQQLERAERDLEQTERDIRNALGRRSVLQTELSTIPRFAALVGENGEIVNPEERLNSLRRELLTKSSVYSEDHPDILRLRREIRALGGDVGSAQQLSAARGELVQKEAELQEALTRYSPDHPTVARLRSNVDSLRSEVQRLEANPAPRATTQNSPNNPRYLQVRAQLDLVQQELSALNSKRDALQTDLTTFEERLRKTPQTEREWLRLTRDYDVSVNKYNEIRAQIDEARRAQTLESAQKGERFTILDPARAPLQPISPNRPFIFFFGLIMASALSIGAVIALEVVDSSVRGSKDLIATFGAPPIGTIPRLKNGADVAASNRQRLLVGTAMASTVAVVWFILF